MSHYVIGLDYGTDSVRAVLIDADNGAELASSVHFYQRWAAGKYCRPSINQFRQHPMDYVEGLEHTIKGVLETTAVDPTAVKGICVDTTGSSPVAVNATGIPLCMTPGFEENPNAMVILWKDHTAIAEADEINALARNWGGEDYTRFEGGVYSSEWFWAKILHVIREDEAVKEAAFSWVEHCDLMTAILIGNEDVLTLKRSRCAAGHKAMWHESWGGLPPEEFLGKLDPELASLRNRLYAETYTSDMPAGNLSEEWAKRLGLTTDTVISVGTFDAHAGAVGVAVEPGSLVRVMGTSTCDMMVADDQLIGTNTVKGICGQVSGSILPGMIGLEAGQSAFGDLLAWFKSLLTWPLDNMLAEQDWLSDEQKQKLRDVLADELIPRLTAEAEAIPLEESIPIALDWINGRRTPDANQALKSAMMGLSLGTSPAHIFKALVNAICFGSKKIVDRFESEGVAIKKVVGIGGVARKSPFIMQTLANTLNRPIEVAASDYAPALGAAIYAARAAGLYPDVLAASRKLGSKLEASYQPQPESVKAIKPLYRSYEKLADFVEEITQQKVNH